jgi:hypothetical protein
MFHAVSTSNAVFAQQPSMDEDWQLSLHGSVAHSIKGWCLVGAASCVCRQTNVVHLEQVLYNAARLGPEDKLHHLPRMWTVEQRRKRATLE